MGGKGEKIVESIDKERKRVLTLVVIVLILRSSVKKLTKFDNIGVACIGFESSVCPIKAKNKVPPCLKGTYNISMSG
jgi:hypothetical protein